MASGLNSQKRFALRFTLITGSTLSAIIGAQSLISLENQDTLSEVFLTPAADIEAVSPVLATQEGAQQSALLLVGTPLTSQSVEEQVEPTPITARAAPSITVLRHSGQLPAASAPVSAAAPASVAAPASQPVVIQPPSPMELAPPAPVIVQGPAPVIVQQAPGASSVSAPSVSAPPAPVTRSSR
jgi:hypothetical protein